MSGLAQALPTIAGAGIGFALGGPMGAMAGASLGGTVGGALSKPKTPQLPTLQAPTVMPLPNDQAATDAARKQMQMRSAQSGRASTLIQGGGGNPGFSGSTKMGG